MSPIAAPESQTKPAFCPACWTALSASDIRCRRCGAEVETLSSRPYAGKLLGALSHPIGEVREWAAQLLGEVGERNAREPLMRIASDSRDPYQAATALRSLARLLDRFPDLPPVDWTQFARPGRPITMRIAAVEIHEREAARGRHAVQGTRG